MNKEEKKPHKNDNIRNLPNKSLVKKLETKMFLLEQEIEERKKLEKKLHSAIKEKETLLREIHHRVKNNMQLISSLLRLQSRFIKDEKTQEVLKETVSRIKSIALVHERVYQSGNLSQIDFRPYIHHLTDHLAHLFLDEAKNIKIEVESDEIHFSIGQAVPCGLILTELVSNALKHAFPGNKAGKVIVRMEKDKKGFYNLIVEDSGTGLPDGINLENPNTLGLMLVKDSVQQLEGNLKVKKKEGTVFKITFPASPADES
ncbi:MAG: sensor histidine kinase [Acidobacteriota bacterium]